MSQMVFNKCLVEKKTYYDEPDTVCPAASLGPYILAGSSTLNALLM